MSDDKVKELFQGAMAISNLLPCDARRLLIEAAEVAPDLPAGESAARARAVEVATARIKTKYPKLFKD
jgi:hypothetical protein